eukprot:Amastigsp_a183601_3.p3 type:complete len:121 gc:universal Amastigsp_a183601_3:452-90(-)
MKRGYAGTLRSASNLRGRKSCGLSSGSRASHLARSASSRRYSGGGLYDSSVRGSLSLGAGSPPRGAARSSSAHRSKTSGSGRVLGLMRPSRMALTIFATFCASHFDGTNRDLGSGLLTSG